MMFRIVIALFIGCFSSGILVAQGYIFGPKVGLSTSFQNWNGFERDPIFKPHFSVFVESHDELSNGSLYAELGYHTRGSSELRFGFTGGGSGIASARQSFEFNNIALSLGAKQMISKDKKYNPYYLVAVRAEYNVRNNLDQYIGFGGYFPIPDFVRRFTYGFTVGGGFERQFSELTGGALEIRISPDLANQYDQPELGNVVSPFTGNIVTLREQRIKNINFEVSFVFRFMRKVIYVD